METSICRSVILGIICGLLLHHDTDSEVQLTVPRMRFAPVLAQTPAMCATMVERGRAEYPLPLLASLPRLWPPLDMPKRDQMGGRSSMASPTCALFIEAPGEGLPLGQRLVGWMTAYFAAENFGVTFVHASFDRNENSESLLDASAPSGGWDAALGLGSGEATRDSLHSAAATAGRATPEIKLLASWNGVRWNEDAFRRGPWWADLNDDSSNCGKILRVPSQSRPYDSSWLTKGAMALKFARARALREASGLDPLLRWDADRDVNIAVHVRRVVFANAEGEGTSFEWDDEVSLSTWELDENGNGGSKLQYLGQRIWYPTREAVLARIVRETVLPALLAEGLPAERLVVHVFSQWPHAEGFSALASLEGTRGGGTGAGGGGVRVSWHLGAALSAWETLFHLTQADVLVGSASHFSFFAAQLSSRPLVLAQEDFDKWRLCGEGSVCCRRDGTCEFYAGVRMREAARRLGALRRCGAGLA